MGLHHKHRSALLMLGTFALSPLAAKGASGSEGGWSAAERSLDEMLRQQTLQCEAWQPSDTAQTLVLSPEPQPRPSPLGWLWSLTDNLTRAGIAVFAALSSVVALLHRQR